MANLLQLLREKHSKDTFVDECLMGSAGNRRLDAWVMLPTWSPPTCIGYEIKTDRSDFLRDDKWPAYLPVCHQFYFVAPAGLIQPAEVPEGCGLMLASANGARLYTKVKAPRREVDNAKLVNLMRHVLMVRTQIVEPHFSGRRGQKPQSRQDRIDGWRKVYETNREAKKLGYGMRHLLSQRTREIDAENERLRAKLKRWGGFAARLRAHGIDPDGNEWQARSSLDKVVGAFPPGLVANLRDAERQLGRLAEFAKRLEGGAL